MRLPTFLYLAAASVATALVAPTIKPHLTRRPVVSSVTAMRGGAAPQMSAVAISAFAGAFTMPSVLGATALATVPCGLAFIRQAYIFSFSYGLTAACVAGFILQSACPVTNTWVFGA